MKLFSIVLILNLYITLIQGQQNFVKLLRAEKLESIDEAQVNELYLKSNYDFKSNLLDLYLINQTKENVIYQCDYEGNFGYGIEGLDINGKWKLLDRRFDLCGLNLNNSFYTELPPKKYTWRRIPIPEINDGTYNTIVRILIKINDITIYSEPIEANIDFFRFYPRYTKEIEINKEFIENSRYTDDEIQQYLKIKGSIYLTYKEYDEAIRILKYLEDEYPNNYEAKRFLAMAITKKVENITTLDEMNKILLYHKVINLINDIPKWDENYTKSIKMNQSMNSYIGEINNLEQKLVEKCEKNANNYECYIKSLNEIISIKLDK